MALGMILENGWPECDLVDCDYATIPGTTLRLPFQRGFPFIILQAFIRDLDQYIEPVMNARGISDEGSWTEGNSVYTSNHKGATAFDYNWSDHPMGQAGAGWDGSVLIDGDQVPAVNDLLVWYEGMVFWGNNWSSPKDSMHFQMGYDTYGPANAARVQNFIDRKIRADGFSTFRRGAAPATPPGVDVLVQAMAPTSVGRDRLAALFPAVSQCLRDCDCTTVERIAMWCAQIGHESAGLRYMEEIASGAAYEGRTDLGNTQPGDGVRFKGRGPIQVTGRRNYTVLSQWAYGKGLVPSPTFFVDNPAELASDCYGFIGVTWYWTTQRPMNDAADARDIVRATQYVNGGTNGLEDSPDGTPGRRTRYNRTLAMGDQLLALITDSPSTPGDDMAQVPQDQWDRVYRELTQQHPSRSAVHEPNEGLVDTWAGMTLNTDGNVDLLATFLRAWLGHPGALARLRDVAAGTEPGRSKDDAQLAQAILATVGKPMAVAAVAAAPVTDQGGELAAANAEIARLQAENARLRDAVANPPVSYVPAPVEPASVAVASTAGQLIGQAYDALQALRLADALPIEERAPLAALIQVLGTKNGAQL